MSIRLASKRMGSEALSQQEQVVVAELQQRDREVRSREAAHLAAGGPYITGGPTYRYQKGPDGRQYAVEGEVSIDTSRASTPEATIQKAEILRRAAMATADPSAEDLAVAAAASGLESEARIELQRQQADEKAADEKSVVDDPNANPLSRGKLLPNPESTFQPATPFFRDNGAGQAQKSVGQIFDLVA